MGEGGRRGGGKEGGREGGREERVSEGVVYLFKQMGGREEGVVWSPVSA